MSRRRELFVCLLALLAALSFSAFSARLSAVSASARKSFRVMAYNINVGVGMDEKLDLERIANVINNEHPDLVGLQEVDRPSLRNRADAEISAAGEGAAHRGRRFQ